MDQFPFQTLNRFSEQGRHHDLPAFLHARPTALALEQRFMFDGAAATDAAHAAGDSAVLSQIADVPAAVVVREADAGLNDGKKEAVIVDTSVADYKTLEAGVKNGIAIIEINGSQDGLAQIANWAENQSGYDAIHILSHGSEGTLNLGTNTLGDTSLSSELVQAELAEIGHALNAGGDLLLYGCDVAAGSDGTQFIADLAAATGADVAASSDATGSADRGGDWVLEGQTGSIDVRSLAIADYDDLLTTLSFSGSDADLDYSNSTITRTIDGYTFTLSSPSYMGYDASYGGGLWSYDGSVNGNNISLTISVEAGYTFDISSFKAYLDNNTSSGDLSIVVTDANNSITPLTLSGLSQASWLDLNPTINDVQSVTISFGNYGIFQDIFITDIKPMAPSFTSGTTASFTENGTGTAYTAIATASSGSVTYALSGTDASLFNLDVNTGVVTFKTTPDYEAPADSGANNVYDITITATDSNDSSIQNVAISVTDVNEYPPTLSTPTAASYSDTSANDTFGNTSGTLGGSDQDGSATLTYGISGGTTGGSTNVSGTIYDVSQAGTYGTLYVKSSTGAYVYVPNDSAINALTSGSTSETFTVTTSDGTASANATYTVNLTGANDAPTLTTPTAASYTDTSANDSFSNTTGTLAGSDRDTGATLTYGISGGTGGSYTINSTTYDIAKAGTYGTLYVLSTTGAYVYVPSDSAINARSASTSETFTVTTSDGTASANATYTVNLTGTNDAPTLATPTSASYTDTSASDTFSNTTGTLAGSDRDSGATLTYGISGGSTGGSTNIGGTVYDVSLTGTYGTLYVLSSTGAYVYVPSNSAINALTGSASETFTVTTSDGTATANATYTVNLTGANDTPTNISLSNNTVGQSGGSNATVGTFSTTDADSGQTYTYTLVAGDGSNDSANSLFNISGSTIRANDASALVTGTYNVYIRTTDSGGATYDRAFTITVSDDVAPTVSSVSVPANGSYAAGATLDFTVTFDEAVTVDTAGGTPRIALTVGGSTVYATYQSGSGSTALVFRYTVQSGNNDSDGITVGALSLNGGTLKDAANNAATLTLNSVGSTAGVLVDTSAPGTPTLAISSDSGSSNSDGVTNTTSQTITVSGEVGASVDLDFGDGSSHATGTIGGGGTFTTSAHSYAVGSHTISVTLTDTAGNVSSAGTETIVVDTTAPSVTTSASQSISTTSATNGATVCALTATDATAIAGFTDALTWSISGTDAGDFSISGNSLQINNAGGLALGDYTVQVTATDTAGNTTSRTLTVSVVNGPAVSTASASYTDTATNDTFANQTGTISATANTGSITGYGINGGTTGGSTNIGGTVYDVSLAGTYGTLYVKSSDGSYVYVPTSNAALNAAAATVTDTFTVEATDGGGTAGNTLTITINGVNDTPTLAAPTAATYTDTAAADTFGNTTGSLAGADRDSGDSLSYGITGGSTGGSTNIGGTVYDVSLAGSYGTLYVKSSDGSYVYVPDATAIDAVTADLSDTFTVSVSDGSLSATRTYTVNIVAANDAPTLTVPATLTVTEDVGTAVTGISFADVDAGSASVSATLAVGSGTLAAASGSGVTVGGSGSATLTLTGSIADINAFIAASEVTFTTAANATADITLTTTINDNGHTGPGGAQSDSDTTTIHVTAVEDAPIAGGIAGQGATTSTPFSFTLPTSAFTDPDAGSTLTYTVTLADGSPLPSWLTFDPATHTFSGTPADSDSGSLSIRVTASDGSLSTSTTFALDVTAPPSNNNQTINETIPGNTTAEPQPVVATSTPQAPDTSGNTPTFLPSSSQISIDAALSTSLAPTPTDTFQTQSTVQTPAETTSPPATFQIVTLPAGTSDGLVLYRPISDTQVPVGGELQFTVPTDTFATTGGDTRVVLDLRLADGRPLPAWIRFDATSGKLLIKAPPGIDGQITLLLVARDTKGHEAATTFRLLLGSPRAELDRPHGLPAGRAGLDAQLQEALRHSRLSRHLFHLARN
jgi:large repetitive protein